MKFEELLQNRDTLLHQARLANVAYAYQWLGDFTTRVARAGLRGEVTLRAPDPSEGLRAPRLIAEDFSQSVIEEHFLEEEIAELAAVLAFSYHAALIVELKFRLEDLGNRVLPMLRAELEAAGIGPPGEPVLPIEDSNLDAA